MLTWSVVLALAAGVYLQRAAGALVVRTERLPDTAKRVLEALPLAIIGGVVALTAATSGGEISIDARLGGLAVAAACAAKRLPMMVSVVAAATTTALLRQFGWG